METRVPLGFGQIRIARHAHDGRYPGLFTALLTEDGPNGPGRRCQRELVIPGCKSLRARASKLSAGNGTGTTVRLSDDMGYQAVGQRWLQGGFSSR